MNIKAGVLLVVLLFSLNMTAQKNDSTKIKQTTKKGWSFGAIPVIAYDSDIGFKYGGLVNFYDYGKGDVYPDYKHSIFLEWSQTTKGSGINQVTYDSKYLIPSIRVSGEISYLTEKGLDFYGYNGYKAIYNSRFEDDEDTTYLSRMFYRQERKLLRLRADFQGNMFKKNLYWVGGLVHYNVKLDTIDTKKLNKGKKDEDKLPYVDGGLFGYYKTWNILPKDQYNGGNNTLLKVGSIYDTRDNEPNPMKGLWTEILFLWSPGFVGNDYEFAKFILTHRQYFTIIPEELSFAYRVAYQGKLYGDVPSYMLPFIFSAGRFNDRDGLGGAKTMRGILRNRIVGEDIAYANLELRWKFIRTIIFNQNIYLALSAFTDLGMVTREYEINETVVGNQFFPDTNEGIHQSFGAGFRIALNENFIISSDYGIALDKKDGDKGLYISLNWLF